MTQIVKVVKDSAIASKDDIKRMMVSVQNILDAANEYHERLERAPIAVKIFLEEHDNDINSLRQFQKQIHSELLVTR